MGMARPVPSHTSTPPEPEDRQSQGVEVCEWLFPCILLSLGHVSRSLNYLSFAAYFSLSCPEMDSLFELGLTLSSYIPQATSRPS